MLIALILWSLYALICTVIGSLLGSSLIGFIVAVATFLLVVVCIMSRG